MFCHASYIGFSSSAVSYRQSLAGPHSLQKPSARKECGAGITGYLRQLLPSQQAGFPHQFVAVAACADNESKRAAANANAELLQIPPLAAQLLKMCDGQTSLEEIVLRIQLPDAFRSIPVEEVARFGIDALVEQQLISVMSL